MKDFGYQEKDIRKEFNAFLCKNLCGKSLLFDDELVSGKITLVESFGDAFLQKRKDIENKENKGEKETFFANLMIEFSFYLAKKLSRFSNSLVGDLSGRIKLQNVNISSELSVQQLPETLESNFLEDTEVNVVLDMNKALNLKPENERKDEELSPCEEGLLAVVKKYARHQLCQLLARCISEYLKVLAGVTPEVILNVVEPAREEKSPKRQSDELIALQRKLLNKTAQDLVYGNLSKEEMQVTDEWSLSYSTFKIDKDVELVLRKLDGIKVRKLSIHQSVLNDSHAQTVGAFLAKHPEIEELSLDRNDFGILMLREVATLVCQGKLADLKYVSLQGNGPLREESKLVSKTMENLQNMARLMNINLPEVKLYS
eukprot:snap_masked-scaffold_12-processed-gene-4.12-mRNA-1 protein AED:1.00 eAED:1.00 QI:0/-1/0/0/-1/1/1/0/371